MQLPPFILDAIQQLVNNPYIFVVLILLALPSTVSSLQSLFSVILSSLSSLVEPSTPVIHVDLSPELQSIPSRTVPSALSLPNRPGKVQCYQPASMRFLGEVRVDTPEEVREAVSKARAAQVAWASTSFNERRRVLRMISAIVLRQSDDITRLSCIDTGKTRVDAQLGEILTTLGKIDWLVAKTNGGEDALRAEYRVTNFTSMHKSARMEYVPLGVIGVIAPWNYPFYNMYNHISAALFSGNACVIKMSEYSAWSGSKFVRVAREVLKAAGHNEDLVQVVNGFGETGAALVNAADKIVFTGSPQIGKLVMRGASSTLTPVVLELGGKDPLIVCEDVSGGVANGGVVPIALRGVFGNAGQNCVGIERVYVFESIYDEFIQTSLKAVESLRVGPSVDPNTGAFLEVDMGAITTAMQLDLIQGLVDDAVSKGAILHCGGYVIGRGGEGAVTSGVAAITDVAPPTSAGLGSGNGPRSRRKSAATSFPSSSSSSSSSSKVVVPSKSRVSKEADKGLFYAPTILSNVDHTMRIANEEVFGPVLAIFKVKNDSDEEAIRLANSTSYGLGATVYSGNPARANKIAAKIRSGMIGVNAYGLNYLVQSLPFGGVGVSGIGRFQGAEGLRELCLSRSVVTDVLPFLSVPTPTPKPIQFPLASNASDVVKGVISLQFGETILARLAGLFTVASN
jgi:acyl-CoA reductase-like NAD-dependent aldehyde dehydrogenase